MTSSTNQNRLLSRQSSLGAMPDTKNTLLQSTVPLSNSRSVSAIHDYIQRERKAHTMAPSTRILGPSSNLGSNMFASTSAPSDAQMMKSSHVTQATSNTKLNSYSQSVSEMADAVGDNHKEEEEEEDYNYDDDDDDDDDAPIIVKVRYDPDAGGPPSEDIIRQAVDKQLKQQSGPKMTNDPIVLNFLKRPTQPQVSSILVRPQQPVFNRPTAPIPQLITRPRLRVPISPQEQLQQQSLQSLQQQQQQYQQFSQPQQLQYQLKQQQLQLQEKQRQQQQQQQEQQRRQQELLLQQQKQKQQQLQLQEKQRQQQQQQEEQQRRQQELLLQQQKQEQLQLQEKQRQQQQGEEQQRRQQELLLQQQKQKQQIQQFLQQQQQRKQQQKQLEQQQIQQQLQLERQQQYQQLLRQQPRQKQQELQQQGQQNYQQQQYFTLPPMGPRPSRTIPSMRSVPMNQLSAMFLQNNKIRPIPLRNPQQMSTMNLQQVPNHHSSLSFISDSLPTGLIIHL